MNETDFWRIVRTDPSASADTQCQIIEDRLSRLTSEEITGFADRLAQMLYQLDLKELAKIPISGTVSGSGSPVAQSEDRFLYARCAVILAGPDAYSEVLSRAESFSPYTSDSSASAEELLEVAPAAFETVTGEEWDHIEPCDYETGSNESGWQ